MKDEEKEKIILKVVDKYYDIKKDYSARNRALMMVSEVLGELNMKKYDRPT